MSSIFTDPLVFGGLVNINIKANRNTPLNLGQGTGPTPPAPTAPSAAPVLVLVQTTDTSIEFTFDTSTISGTQPISYEVRYGEAEPLSNIVLAIEVSPNTYSVTVSGLIPETTYLFKTVATNAAGSVESVVDDYSTDPVVPAPPTIAPTPPILVDAGSTSLFVRFDVAGVEGTQPITYSINYGTTTALGSSYPAILGTGTIYSSAPDGLTSSTNYFMASVATNADGSKTSEVAGPFATLAGVITPPSVAPTVPTYVSATSDSITVSMDAAGITGTLPITYSFLVGTTTSPATPVTATLTTGTIYEGTATGLTASTDYYFTSVATNTGGSKESAVSAPFQTISPPPPPPPTALQNLAILTFLAIDEQGNWSINTSGMPEVGSMMLTGSQAGTWAGTDGKAYLNGIRAKTNTKLIVSMGGSGMNQFLTQAFPSVQGARDLCNTIWNVLFGANTPNTLNWSNAAWAGLPNRLFFDGLDIDMEGAIGTGIMSGFMDQWVQNKTANPSIAVDLAMAPQSPNTWMTASPSTSVFTDNMTAVPFTSSASALNTLSSGFLTSLALIAPQWLHHYDDVFVQCYNQGTDNYPGAPAFITQMAQWAYLIMRSNRTYAGSTTKLIWGFASTDASPIWNAGVDGPALASVISSVNTLVSEQLVTDGVGSCVATDWSGGFGMWNSPSNVSPITAVYSSGSVLTPALMGSTAVLYANASGNNTTWDASLPLTDAR